ncbi:MAG: nucleotidyltransferase domain-containing protein [Nitrospiraceae bacterium]|nr:nucleotidyltransferase domain-containing protein [Nitrospiraceae bacterium]
MKTGSALFKHPHLNYNEQRAIGSILAGAPNFGQLSKILLYGSKARGDSFEESDIDLLFITSGPVSLQLKFEIYDFVYEIEVENDVVISVVFAASEAFEAGAVSFLRNVRREGITLWSIG